MIQLVALSKLSQRYTLLAKGQSLQPLPIEGDIVEAVYKKFLGSSLVLAKMVQPMYINFATNPSNYLAIGPTYSYFLGISYHLLSLSRKIFLMVTFLTITKASILIKLLLILTYFMPLAVTLILSITLLTMLKLLLALC